MSANTTTRTRDAGTILGWIAGGIAVIAAVALLAVALWPASEADKAYDDGHDVGTAVNHLYYADSSDEVDEALVELEDAVVDTREHAGDAVYEQASDQEDALSRAADGFAGVHTSTDSWEVDVYQAELNDALADLDDNAEDFQENAPEVEQAFWDGYEDGVNGL